VAPAASHQPSNATAPAAAAAGQHSTWGGPYGPDDGEIKFGNYGKGLNFETLSSGGSSDAAAAAAASRGAGETMGGMGGAGEDRNPMNQLGNMEGPPGPSPRAPSGVPAGYGGMPWGPPMPSGVLPPASAPGAPFFGSAGPPDFGYDGGPPRNLMPPIPGLPMSLPMGLGNPGPLPSLPMALNGPHHPVPSSSMGFPGMLPRGGLLPGGMPYPHPSAGGIAPSSSSAMPMYPPATVLAAARDAGGGAMGMVGMPYGPSGPASGGGFPHGGGMGMEGMKQGGPPVGMMSHEMVVTPCAPHAMPPAPNALLPNEWARTG
jgi:hypothetical protein